MPKPQNVERRDPAADASDDSPEPLTSPGLRIRSRLSALIISIVTSGVTLGGVAYAYDKLEEKAKDAGSTAATVEVARLKAQVDGDHATLEVVKGQVLQQSQDIHEVQQDIRALYKATLTGQRQERLERPPPEHPNDGGIK